MRSLLIAALVATVLAVGCASEEVAAPNATTTAPSLPTTTVPTTTAKAPKPPPPVPVAPDVPANLPDEFLMLAHGRLVSLEGKTLGRLRGYSPAGTDDFRKGDEDAWWTFRNGRVVRAHGQKQVRLPGISRHCEELGHVSAGTLFSCTGNASLLLREPSGKTRAIVSGLPGSIGGHWQYAYPSPDGSRLLLGWSDECEIPSAYFVSSSGGEPTEITGVSEWKAAPEAIALGWTSDGRALALMLGPGCGDGYSPPGVYAVDGSSSPTLIARTTYAAYFRS
jgi:hypothetical protein